MTNLQNLKIDKPFEVVTNYTPSGDQPQAIDELAKRVNCGDTNVVLLGATGTGKSATTAWLIEQVQRPTLVLEPNKTLAAQICQEFRTLMPNNAVEYFVSYYDYYQPEAYIAQTDTYIEKDSSINSEVERLRHLATTSLITRRDTVVVASVSCIYGLGTPEEYIGQMITIKVGEEIGRQCLLRKFINMQYDRNDIDFARGTFRVRGDIVEIIPMYEELPIRIEFFGDQIDAISVLHPVTGKKLQDAQQVHIFPASHYVAGQERMQKAIVTIRAEMEERVQWFRNRNMMVEAQRLEQRTNFDIEMLEQTGMCKGIENYSRHIDQREVGSPPNTLLDFFDNDFLLVIDESHVTVPQIGAMFEGDASRKRQLIDHGFRLPSALDNRPLKWAEFLERIGQTVYLSATPGDYELGKQLELSKKPVELIIRPTGLLDPEVEVCPTENQIDNLYDEIHQRVKNNERVLVTTLTKRLAEELTSYFRERGVKVEYLHSDVDTLRRIELLRELRMGKFDVLVGINLLREGLDLPEVSLVAILDADKQGFLRSYRSLIQTIGRAARNVSGKVIMFADNVTEQMRSAISETNRRRKKQEAYNLKHGINPQPLRKKIADVTDQLLNEQEQIAELASSNHSKTPTADLTSLIDDLLQQMRGAAEELNFELAARLRDEITDLKKELRVAIRATE